jgi:uncharacterized coiled-coil DUF342 family protein
MTHRFPSLAEICERLDRVNAEARELIAQSQWLRAKSSELLARIHGEKEQTPNTGG